MNLKVRVLRAAALFCVCLLPKMSFGSACTTTTVANLLGTSCSIGDVNYAFLPGSFNSSLTAFTANDVTLMAVGSDPLNPEFSLTPTSGGSFSASAFGVNTLTILEFDFSWDATILTSGLEFGSVTSTLVNPVVPALPSIGVVDGGDFRNFSAAVVRSGQPTFNPTTVNIDLPSLTGLNADGALDDVSAMDNTGTGATTSVDAFELQYHLTPTPEPSSLLLLGTGLLSLAPFLRRRFTRQCG